MKRVMQISLGIFITFVATASFGWDISVWGPDWGYSPYPVLYCLPDGGGDALPSPITVRVLNDYGNPIHGIPADEIRLYIGVGVGYIHESRICGGEWIEATGPTNSNGIAEFPLGPFHVYGANGPAQWHVKVKIPGYGWKDCLPNDPAYNSPTYKLYFLSPDYNHNSAVDLPDVATFQVYLSNGTYDIWADLNGDGLENLADVGRFIIGPSCAGF